MSAIWCTAGVSGMLAPAMAATRGLHTPQATTTCSTAIPPRPVTTVRMRGRPNGRGLDLQPGDLGVVEHGQHAPGERPARA